MLALIDYVLKNAGVETIDSPEGIEVSTRTMNQRTLKVVMNHNEYPVRYGWLKLKYYILYRKTLCVNHF